MARYVANIDQSYKQSIPYHFTCNRCGEACQKSYEITVSVKSSSRSLGGARRLANRQHDRQVKKSVKEKNRAIERYRAKLAAGRVAGRKLAYIPLNSQCEHCGWCQPWNPDTGNQTPAVKNVGMIIATLGFLGTFGTAVAWAGHGVKPIVPIICAGVLLAGLALVSVGDAVQDRREVAWFREHMANEPNDPEKLPVIDK